MNAAIKLQKALLSTLFTHSAGTTSMYKTLLRGVSTTSDLQTPPSTTSIYPEHFQIPNTSIPHLAASSKYTTPHTRPKHTRLAPNQALSTVNMASSATVHTGHATNSPTTIENKNKNEKRDNTSRRKYELPPPDYKPPAGTLRVHSDEQVSGHGRGRILQQWSLCRKPRNEPSGGCRNGYFGYFVRSEGVIRAAIWVGGGSGVCDWVEDDEGDDDGEGNEIEEDEIDLKA